MAIGKLGVVLGTAAGLAFPAAIPFLLPAVGVGLVVAKSKINKYEAIEREYAARDARGSR